MLILTRKISETIKVGDDISITLLGIKGNQAKFGISAPRNISVHREEVYQRIKMEKLLEKAKHDFSCEA